MTEFKRMLRKYPNRQIDDIMKHLFHGSKTTDPRLIYASEDGFDPRFSNSGLYGRGTYFADNSHYSSKYAYSVPNDSGSQQLFLALVLVGETVALKPNSSYNIPPLKEGSLTERYDSINNEAEGHYIIYDSLKSYPGYLITFK